MPAKLDEIQKRVDAAKQLNSAAYDLLLHAPQDIPNLLTHIQQQADELERLNGIIQWDHDQKS